jgi:AcrR family transcriptional regulator
LFAECGLSAGAVYRHFASKDDMILAIAEESMCEVLEVIHSIATHRPGRSVGDTMADVLDTVKARSEKQGFAGLVVLVWAEALRNRSLAAKLNDLLARIHSDLTEVVRKHQDRGALPQDVTAEAIATTLTCIVPGYILQLSVLDAQAVEGVSGVLRALWPESED